MQKKILDALVDKYEKSRSFNNRNKNHQSFSVEPVKLFRQYSDDSLVDFCLKLNSDLRELEKNDIVRSNLLMYAATVLSVAGAVVINSVFVLK